MTITFWFYLFNVFITGEIIFSQSFIQEPIIRREELPAYWAYVKVLSQVSHS